MAVTLEELVVKLEAENSKFIAAMTASQKTTEKAMQGIQEAVTEMATEGTSSAGMFQDAMSTMAGVIGGDIVIGAFNMAKDAAKAMFNSLVVEGVAASSEAIDSMNRLNNSLAQNGNYTSDVSKEMANWAGELQKTTKYEDDAIIKSAAYIETLGRLDKDGLQRATEASLNLASALGIDLETATRMVGKAAAGEVAAFSKLGMSVEDTGNKARNFENAMKAITALGPAAKGEVASYSGAVAFLSNGYSEVQEAIGGTITKNVAVTETMKAVGDAFFGAAGSIDDNKLMLRSMIADGIVVAIDALGVFITTLDSVMRAGSAVFNGLRTIVAATATFIGSALNAVGIVSDETFANLIKTTDKAFEDMKGSFSNDTLLGDFAVKINEVGLKAEEATAKVKMGMEASVEPINQAKNKTIELSDAMKAVVAEGVNLQKSYLDSSVQSKALAEQQLADAQLIRDQKMLAMQEEQDNNAFSLTALQTRNEQEAAIKEEYAAAQLEALNTQQANEANAVNAALANDKISKEQHAQAILAMSQKYNNERAKLDQKEQERKYQDNQKEVKDREATFDNLAALQKSHSAYAASVGKIFAIRQTVMNTSQGAQAAYASLAGIPVVGPALGIAAAAAVIADGATRINEIRGAKNGITEVPGVGNKDSFGPVALAPGERVVPGETNQDLKQAIAMILGGQGGGGGNVQIEIILKDNLMDMIETKLVERERTGVSLRVS